MDSYWNCYPANEEAQNRTKTAWSVECLEGGILEQSLFLMRTLLSAHEDDYPETLKISDQRWCVKRLTSHSLRITLFATTRVDSELLREIYDSSRESLVLCVLSTIKDSIWPVSLGEPQIGAAAVIPFYPVDVDALALQEVDIWDLLTFKIYRRLILSRSDSDTQFNAKLFSDYSNAGDPNEHFRRLDNLLELEPEERESWVEHPFVPRITAALSRGRGCLLSGPSSSGKSVLAFQVGHSLLLDDREVFYLNLSQVVSPPVGALKGICRTDSSERPPVIILDDLQSNPAVARFLLSILNMARRAKGSGPPTTLAISWPDYTQEAASWHEDCLPLPIRAYRVGATLAHKFDDVLSKDDIDSLLEKLGDDLLLLRLSLEESKKLGARAHLGVVAGEIWKRKTKTIKDANGSVVRIALVSGSLGRYDLTFKDSFLIHEAQVERSRIDDCLKSGLLRRHQEGLTIGHRSLCGLLCDWLGARDGWQSLSEVNGPGNTTQVVLDYLRSLGSSLAVDSLRALHARAGFKQKPQMNRRAAALVEIWQTFNAVVERIENQQLRDPTWGQNPASCMFAVQTFNKIGKPELAEKSVEYLREQWFLRGNELNISTQLVTRSDFDQIRITMEREDELTGDHTPPGWQSVSQIDMDEFHRTWLMGLFLCAEGESDRAPDSLMQLAEAAENRQLPSGAYYPERVPWATARVLLGLAACGRTIDTSASIARTTEWLLRDRKDGGACSGGVFQSGTGSWNTELETTGIVLLALAAVGYDCASNLIETARNFLLSERLNWTAPGRELEGSQALQAYLDTGGAWDEIAYEAHQLSQWARNEALWKGATLSAEESLDQTCRVAQIAAHLINIGWSAVRSDLPAFLDALAMPAVFREELRENLPHEEIVKTLEVTSEEIHPSDNIPFEERTSRDSIDQEDLAVASLHSMSELHLENCTVVGNYMRFDERVRNKLRDWKARISQPLINPTVTHENYLIWAAPGSGKSFFIQEIAYNAGKEIDYYEINIARESRESIEKSLDEVKENRRPTLCLLDEMDAREGESWPYELCFPLLDLNLQRELAVVFVLVGSSSTGLQGMIAEMARRKKGKDLLDRIPSDRRFEIPALAPEDRIIIVASQIVEASKARGHEIREIEKLALYYALHNKDLRSPRQLRDLSVAAVSRVLEGESRLKYDDLFFSGDRQNQRFWAAHQEAASSFSEIYLHVD